jgi:hypothetical protein
MATSTGTVTRQPLSALAHLTDRDRCLLDLIEEHRVLTSDQVHRLFFTGLRTCQLRLTVLRNLDLLDRFRFACAHGGTQPWKWVLGLAGARFQAAGASRTAPTERAHREHMLRLSASPTLDHLLATNEFFVRLQHATRRGHGVSLDRWWSEQSATAGFLGIRPDGHGLWTCGKRTTGLFVEVDLGTENLARLTSKLVSYSRLVAAGGPSYPVLFWLPSIDREDHLQQLLRRDPPDIPVATATHDADPAGRVWMPIDGWQRLRLNELPSDHGPESAHNPNWQHGQLTLA